jgi:hypothetical protein
MLELSRRLGVPLPRRVPVWVAQLALPMAAAMAVDARLRVSNTKIRDEAGWVPTYRTYREGIAALPDPED